MYMQGRMQSCGEDGTIFSFHSACEGERAQCWACLPCLPAPLTVMVQMSKNITRSHFTALFFSLPVFQCSLERDSGRRTWLI